MKLSIRLIVFIFLFIVGCVRMPTKERSEAMRRSSSTPQVADDLGFESLQKGIKDNIEFIKGSPRIPDQLTFGETKIEKQKYIEALSYLISNSADMKSLQKNIVNYFDFYEVYGRDNWSEILVTSYYSPLIKGSVKKTKEFSQPIYSAPEDMVFIDVEAYMTDFPDWKYFKEKVLEQKSSKTLIRGRVVKDDKKQSKIVPYYKREHIDGEKPIYDKSKIIAYVDPIKAFFLQIQGSGIIEFKNGKRITVGYAAQNGHAYVAIGKLLLHKIPKEKMSMQKIEEYLRTLPAAEIQTILNQNPSYVFFQKLEGKPLAYLGTEVVDGRTVATDNGLFPKGTLAFLQFEKPIFENSKSTEPIKWVQASRFVLDQDTGGAIRGPGRLDLYAGDGQQAEQFAGVMKNPARLYYLVPKSDFLSFLDKKNEQANANSY